MAATVGLFAAQGASAGAEAAQAIGAITPQKGKMRRVVTAHNAEGKSFIANDEIVDAANIWNGTPDHPLGTTVSIEPPACRTRRARPDASWQQFRRPGIQSRLWQIELAITVPMGLRTASS